MTTKTVLITGANKGIGFEIARQLSEQGFHVILTARDKEKGEKATASLKEKGYDVRFIQLDVSNAESCKKIGEEFGKLGTKLDVLINNAGIMIDKGGILELDPEAFHKTLTTNTLGPALVILALLPHMKKDSRIINIASGLGALGSSMGDYAPAYSISKTALNKVTTQLADVLKAKDIVVNSMCPGWVKTDMGGSNAERPVEKGAETAVWLATEAPLSLTGKFFRDKQEIAW